MQATTATRKPCFVPRFALGVVFMLVASGCGRPTYYFSISLKSTKPFMENTSFLLLSRMR